MGTTVLLVLDIQNGIVGMIENSEAYLQRLAPTIDAARKAGLRIIYVTVAMRPGYPEVSARNNMFARVKDHGGSFVEGDPSTRVHSAVSPADGDILVTKRRVSAFHGTDLDVVLRSLDAETLVLAGVSTSGVILSTVRQGADMDYRLVVLEDMCVDRDQELHDTLMKMFTKQAQVVSAAEWIAGLEQK